MADWTQLPRDLLNKITNFLPTPFDILRFRSICTSWRSSITPSPHHLPNRVPVDPQTSTSKLLPSSFFHLSKRTIYLLTLPIHHPRRNPRQGWVIKVEKDDLVVSHLFNPLSESPIRPLPPTFPRILDLIDVQVTELGQEFVLQYVDRFPIRHGGDVYREKVVFSPNPPWNEDETDFVIMTIHVSGRLALFKFRDSKWNVIEAMSSPFDDVIRYQGRFYAVDSTGRAVVVCPNLTVSEVAGSVFGGDKKCLIELDGDLLMVDRYLNVGLDEALGCYNQNYEIYVPNDDVYIMDATVRFKVYKLDWYERNWIEMKDLGDQMLFLGDNCAFAAPASDFDGCKENCIYFTDRVFQSDREDDGPFKGQSIGVFNMEDGSIGPLASFSGYSSVFWPPPAWVTVANN